MEEKKKSNKGLICLVVILLLAVLGLVGYILVDKGVIKLKKETKPEAKVEARDIELDVESDEVVSLMNRALAVDNYEIVSTVHSNFAVFKDGFDINKVSGEDFEFLVSEYLKTKVNDYSGIKEVTVDGKNSDLYSTLKIETFKFYALDYFGPSYEFETKETNGSLRSSCGIYRYSEADGCYVSFFGCGGVYLDRYINKLDKAVKTSEGTIVITLSNLVLVNDPDNNGNNFLRNSVDSAENITYYKNDENVELMHGEEFSDATKNKIDEIFKIYNDKAAKYQFTFKKDGDNYYINKVTRLS